MSTDELVALVRRDEHRLASRVRLDPIPDGSFALRAYREPGDPRVPLDAERRDYVVVGVVTIYGDVAEVQATKGEIPPEAWDDFDAEMRFRGVQVARWTRHRKDGTNKAVERRINR